MALNNSSSGFSNISEFQGSSLPWVTSGTTSATTIVKCSFSRVTKNVTISNLDNSNSNFLRVGFTENGVNGVDGNYFFKVGSSSTITFDVRISDLYIRADKSGSIDFSVFGGLTTIDRKMMPILTGSLNGSTVWEGIG